MYQAQTQPMTHHRTLATSPMYSTLGHLTPCAIQQYSKCIEFKNEMQMKLHKWGNDDHQRKFSWKDIISASESFNLCLFVCLLCFSFFIVMRIRLLECRSTSKFLQVNFHSNLCIFAFFIYLLNHHADDEESIVGVRVNAPFLWVGSHALPLWTQL